MIWLELQKWRFFVTHINSSHWHHWPGPSSNLGASDLEGKRCPKRPSEQSGSRSSGWCQQRMWWEDGRGFQEAGLRGKDFCCCFAQGHGLFLKKTWDLSQKDSKFPQVTCNDLWVESRSRWIMTRLGLNYCRTSLHPSLQCQYLDLVNLHFVNSHPVYDCLQMPVQEIHQLAWKMKKWSSVSVINIWSKH